MAQVTLRNLSKTYPGRIEAVRRVSLEVADGEFVVLVGPSGCGKSTTLRMVAGLEDITSGTVSIGERVVNEVHPKDRNIAMVFQNYALYPHMSVYRNMAFALRLRKTPKPEIDRRVREAARILGIEDLLERRPRALSGGQRQRVAVGRAIVRDPAVFLFDEPLSNLDVKLRVQMRAELKALHLRLKTTTIYVTHDQEEAMTLGDRIAVMCDGVLQQVAPPLQVYRRPVNRFVAGFVGLPPMNFIDGAVERRQDELHFTDGGDVFVRLNGGLGEAAKSRVDQQAVLGVRPEALRLATTSQPAQPQTSASFHINVQVVEPLGDRQDVFGTTSRGDRMIARINAGEHIEPLAPAVFSVDSDALHLFEPGEFGRNLAQAESNS